MNWEEIILHIIKTSEGMEYVNDPDDLGGPTKFGITQTTLFAWRHREVSPEDVAALTIEEAVKIYLSEYVYKPRLSFLPEELREIVLDSVILHGQRKGVKIFQFALRRLGYAVLPDGYIGLETIGVTEKALEDVGAVELINAIVDERVALYGRMNPKFRRGWIARAERFRRKV